MIETISNIKSALCKYDIWISFSIQEIKSKYKRSIIGPFWITISTAIMIFAMGPLYGILFKQDIVDYTFYIAISLIMWQFISGSINDSLSIYVNSENYIKQINIPLAVYNLQSLSKNIIFLTHNWVVIILMFLLFGNHREIYFFELIAGFLIVIVCIFFISLLLSALCARYRDLSQIITNFIQLFFFITPVMWKKSMLDESRNLLINLNPFYHLMNLLRSPLLGEHVPTISFVFSLGLMVLLIIIGLVGYAKMRHKIAYWI